MQVPSITRRMLVAALAGAALLAGCSTVPPRIDAYTEVPIGTVTTYWRTSSGSFGTTDGEVVWTLGLVKWNDRTVEEYLSKQAGSQLYEPGSRALVAVLNPAGQLVQSFDPPMGYRLPLEVGQTWRSSHKVTVYPPGNEVPVDMNWKVEAWENVKVPAGTFRTFRVSTTSSLGDSETIWTAPDLGFGIVKRHTVRSTGHPEGEGVLHGELVSRTFPP
jgi:hypothetical protein